MKTKTARAVAPTVVTAEMVDELARLRAALRTMAKREEELKAALRRDCGGQDCTYRGVEFALRVRFVEQERLDTVAAREQLGEDWCAAHTRRQTNMNIDTIEVL